MSFVFHSVDTDVASIYHSVGLSVGSDSVQPLGIDALRHTHIVTKIII